MTVFFWLSFFAIFYIYIGYLLMLNVIKFFIEAKKEKFADTRSINCFVLNISVIIAAYDEERAIKGRLENLLALDYPMNKLEIIVASDGSTDNTVKIAKQCQNIKVLDFKCNRGRAAVHNDSVIEAKGEIIFFTDAETVFDKNFLKETIKYFSNNLVGCVVGNLFYKTSGTSISESEGLYWKFEKKIRELENNLGILATATGACMAVRKELWKELSPSDDADCRTPLDVIIQGYTVAFAPEAIAYDVPPSSIKGELKSRIRQTSMDFVRTLKCWGWRGWTKHPLVSWGLLSHKVLRWFTSFFMIVVFVSNLFLLNEGLFYQLAFLVQAAFYLTAIIGLAGSLIKKRIPAASVIFSFCVANLGMGIGVIKGLIGKAPVAYKTTE